MDLDDEIRDKELELQVLKEKVRRDYLKGVLKPLGDYSDDEKIAWFNKQYNGAYDTLMKKVEGKYHDDLDEAHFVWEEWLKILGKDVFKVWNEYD